MENSINPQNLAKNRTKINNETVPNNSTITKEASHKYLLFIYVHIHPTSPGTVREKTSVEEYNACPWDLYSSLKGYLSQP